MKVLGNQNRGVRGVLLTPYLGRVDPNVKRVQEYVQEIINRLAWEKIAALEMNLVVNIYSSNAVNAFATTAVEGEDSAWREETKKGKEGTTKNGDWTAGLRSMGKWSERQVTRNLLGFGPDGKPVYEIGVQIGLFKVLKTESELAAVIAHELTHIFEDHIERPDNQKEAAKRWWSSQRFEAVADHGAIDLMEGKFNLDGMLSMLEKLFPPPLDASIDDTAFFAAFGSHHHEGIRFSLAQSYIEYRRRSSREAAPRLDPALPSYVHFTVNPRVEARSSRFEELRPDLLRMIESSLLSHERFQMIRSLNFEYDFQGSRARAPKNPALNAYVKEHVTPSSEQLSRFLVDAFNIIRVSQKPKQDKVDAFIKLLYVFEFSLSAGNMVFQNIWKTVDQNTLWDMTKFLAENSSGENAWRYGASLENLKSLSIDAPLLYKTLFSFEKGQRMLQFLVTTNPEWRSLFHDFPHSLIKDFLVDPKTDNLVAFMDFIEMFRRGWIQTGPLAEPLSNMLLSVFNKPEFFSRITSQQVITDGMVVIFLGSILSDPVGHHNPYFQRNIVNAVRPLLNVFQGSQIALAQQILQKNELSEEEATHFFFVIFGYADKIPLSPKLQSFLMSRMLPLMKRLNITFAFSILQSESAVFDLALSMLNSPQFSSEDKFEIFKFIQLIEYPASNTTSHFEGNSEESHKLAAYVAGLSKDQIFALIEPGVPLDEFLKGAPLDLKDRNKVWSLAQQILHRYSSEATILSLMSFNPAIRKHWADLLSIGDVKRILSRLYKDYAAARPFIKSYSDHGVGLDVIQNPSLSYDAVSLLLDVFSRETPTFSNLSDWHEMYIKILGLYAYGRSLATNIGMDHQQVFETFILGQFRKMTYSDIYRWIGKESVFRNIETTRLSQLLVEHIRASMPNSERPEVLAREFKKIVDDFDLREKFPELYSVLKADLAKEFKVQPQNLDVIFPSTNESYTQQTREFSTEIRGLSVLVALTRKQKVEEQIQLFDYLMGRSDVLPPFVYSAGKNLAGIGPLLEAMPHMKARLSRESELGRAMVINSFLAGPNSFVNDPQNLEKLVGHLLRDVKPEHMEFAKILADALLQAHGRNKSMALSYVIGQKPGTANVEEAEILNSLFLAYGVPGIKLGQYLAFTSDFKEAGLEKLQDSAMPISYLEAIELIQSRLGTKWNSSYKILGIKGSGSVNIAIEYFNPDSGKNEILNISRKNIEASMAHDFRRYNEFLRALTSTPERMRKFGFLLGLSKIIEASCRLELNKQTAFDMQKSVQDLYNRDVRGWHVRTVDAFEATDMAIRMEMGPGITARKVYETDPQVYKEALAAVAQVEFDVLKGVGAQGNVLPVPLHANPDFHDGQVLIDKSSRTVTILDFGQAVPISNGEREFAINVLRLIVKADSLPQATRLANSLFQGGKSSSTFTEAELGSLLSNSDRMDIFVRLISKFSEKGFDLPISAVHWVLAVNRQIVLGQKIGWPVEGQIKTLLAVWKVSGSLSAYNFLHALKEKTRITVEHLKDSVGSTFNEVPSCSDLLGALMPN